MYVDGVGGSPPVLFFGMIPTLLLRSLDFPTVSSSYCMFLALCSISVLQTFAMTSRVVAITRLTGDALKSIIID